MTSRIFDMPVFGPADVFPMMAADELQELAADIKENGLKDPLVVGEFTNEDGEIFEALIDGRNRRAACKLAGIEPEVVRFTGKDATAFVITSNIYRRHMTKGQRAMAVAMIYPEGSQGKKTTSSISKEVASATNVSRARTVLSFAPDLADNVLSGSASLDDAYKTAKQRKDDANSDEAKLASLREHSPELADKVIEGELTLAGAKAEAAARDEQDQSRRWAFTKNLIEGVRGLERDVKFVAEQAQDYDPEYATKFQEPITPSRLRKVAAFASALADQLEKMK